MQHLWKLESASFGWCLAGSYQKRSKSLMKMGEKPEYIFPDRCVSIVIKPFVVPLISCDQDSKQEVMCLMLNRLYSCELDGRFRTPYKSIYSRFLYAAMVWISITLASRRELYGMDSTVDIIINYNYLYTNIRTWRE